MSDNSKKRQVLNWTNWINHELKTPLNRIESLILSLKKSPRLSFDENKIILQMKHSLDECRSTLDSLYIYNKISVDKIVPQFSYVDINKLISSLLQELEEVFDSKKIRVLSEMEALFPIPADESLLKRALSNILVNAVKFSPHESKILISTEQIKDQIYIQVSDQGPGISKAEQEKIFEAYYRAEESEHLPGTGLGLYISKCFMEFQNGSLSLDSELGSGSTFTLSLPCKKNQEAIDVS